MRNSLKLIIGLGVFSLTGLLSLTEAQKNKRAPSEEEARAFFETDSFPSAERLADFGISDANTLRPYLQDTGLQQSVLFAISRLADRPNKLDKVTLDIIRQIVEQTTDKAHVQPIALRVVLFNSSAEEALSLASAVMNKLDSRALLVLMEWIAKKWEPEHLGQAGQPDKLIKEAFKRFELVLLEGRYVQLEESFGWASTPPFSTQYNEDTAKWLLWVLDNMGKIPSHMHRTVIDYLWKKTDSLPSLVETEITRIVATGSLPKAKVILWELYHRDKEEGEQKLKLKDTEVGRRIISKAKEKRPELADYIDRLDKDQVNEYEGVSLPLIEIAKERKRAKLPE